MMRCKECMREAPIGPSGVSEPHDTASSVVKLANDCNKVRDDLFSKVPHGYTIQRTIMRKRRNTLTGNMEYRYTVVIVPEEPDEA